jgi:pimeloyl-ACP methyl ester carboxylesterase
MTGMVGKHVPRGLPTGFASRTIDGADDNAVRLVVRAPTRSTRWALLLHGWPGLWSDWLRVVERLPASLGIVAIDLRGFGESQLPPGEPVHTSGPDRLAADCIRALDRLDVASCVVAGYDIGATVAQHLARTAPERISALVLSNPSYAGIGRRRFDPAHQPELWYQHFHALPLAEALIDGKPDAVAAYLGHFWRHGSGGKVVLAPEKFTNLVATYARPGAFAASIAYHRARSGNREREAEAPLGALIPQPTTVLWGDADPFFPVAWADRLDECFADARLTILPGVGHFVPVEAPDVFSAAVASASRTPGFPTSGGSATEP